MTTGTPDPRAVPAPLAAARGRGLFMLLGWRRDDVVAWRSVGEENLRLTPRPGLLAGATWRVPTPTPADRVDVEALLASRGVPRVP